jgi:hypothetical protein
MSRSRSFWFVMLALGLGVAGCSGANSMPVITAGPRPLGSPSLPGGLKYEEGTVLQLQLEASDKDGDPLIFRWYQVPANPAGTFSDAAIATPTWTVPSPPMDPKQAIHLYVEVEDGNGGVLIGQSPPIYPQAKQ